MQKREVRGITLAIGLCVLCTAPVRAGAVQNKINSTGQKIDALENALDETDSSIRAFQQEQRALEVDIASGQEQISRLSAELDETKVSIQDTSIQITETQEELKQAQKISREQYANMKLRIRFMYENSLNSVLTNILEAGSLSEMLKRANYFEAVMEYDRQKLSEFKATTNKIKEQKEQLDQQEQELQSLKEKQTQKLSEIDTAVAGLKSRLGSTLDKIANSKALREKYEQELEQQKQNEAMLERKKAEEDRKRQEEIRRQEEELRQQREQQQRQEQQRQEQNTNTADNPANSTNNQENGTANTTNNSTGDTYTASGSDLELLSTIIYCEAGNQSYEGQLAVGSVVMNRVASASFPNSISGVIYQSGQFSPVASGRFAHALAAGLGSNCRQAAQAVLNGSRNVDCLYFCVNNGLIDGIVIGDHVFY